MPFQTSPGAHRPKHSHSVCVCVCAGHLSVFVCLFLVITFKTIKHWFRPTWVTMAPPWDVLCWWKDCEWCWAATMMSQLLLAKKILNRGKRQGYNCKIRLIMGLYMLDKSLPVPSQQRIITQLNFFSGLQKVSVSLSSLFLFCDPALLLLITLITMSLVAGKQASAFSKKLKETHFTLPTHLQYQTPAQLDSQSTHRAG